MRKREREGARGGGGAEKGERGARGGGAAGKGTHANAPRENATRPPVGGLASEGGMRAGHSRAARTR